MSRQLEAHQQGQKKNRHGKRFPHTKNPDIETSGAIGRLTSAFPSVQEESKFPPLPDFKAGDEDPSFPAAPPDYNTYKNFPPLPKFDIRRDTSVAPGFPDFNTHHDLPPLPDFNIGHQQSSFPAFPDFPDFTGPSNFPAIPDSSVGAPKELPNFPPLPSFAVDPRHAASDFPPFPNFSVIPSRQPPSFPSFPDMEVGSLEECAAFPGPDSTQVGSAFPAFPDFPDFTSGTLPELSKPRLAELNRSESPIPPLLSHQATLKTPNKRARPATKSSPPPTAKKSKKSVPKPNPKATQRATPPLPKEELGLTHRRLGDVREVHPKYFRPTIDELHAAHYAIRPKEGPRIPYHIGYALALAESERHLARLEDLEDEAAEAVHRLANIQGTMEQWLTAWGQ